MAARRLIKGLTSPWSLGFSGFGLAYGLYHIWDATQSGAKYDLNENLEGKTYIVTGATSGIGQATVEELAKRNARVIMACRCELDFDDLNAASRKKYDGYEVYKQSKLAAAMFARELAERVKGGSHTSREYSSITYGVDTNVSVTVADPGRTKSNLSSQMDGQTFFLSRWLLKIVSFGMGERRVEKAVRPVLFALADPAMEGVNGVFIDRERHEQPWCEAVEDVEKRRRLWNTSEVWTKLSERMQQMRTELGEAAASLDKSVDVKEASSTGRSWKRLWLW
ncbi:hypothetical protein TELCIR_18909 [Teladorsagia circumcincta]|uniref:Oxidoreductase, short chain dehydrogenase/reductase family protein n=1 Tax=Teladorsagia circumcincta TaxID=45464 RepID=A0A2G9TNQ5_TELCI|nr:hypothetical protein TELCIR_18909 [Teladorsagia circumcincta]